MAMPRKSVSERFWERVPNRPIKGCWIFISCRDKDGYGWFSIKRKNHKPHRVAYELAYGPFFQELNVLHECDNPACVRPTHLFLGTQADNIADKTRKGRQATGLRHGAHTKPWKMPTKLTALMIPEIRGLQGTMTLSQAVIYIETHFSCHLDIKTVWHIWHRKTWKHII